jgi:hypothetical protein
MKEILKRIVNKDLVNIYIRMVIIMRVNGSKICIMVMEWNLIRMDQNMKEIGVMIRNKVMEYFMMLMEINGNKFGVKDRKFIRRNGIDFLCC